MTAERSEAGTHLSPANAGPKASLNRLACSKNQSMQTGTLVVPEGELKLPQSTPLSTGPQWKGLGGVVIGAQLFALVLGLPPDTHIL